MKSILPWRWARSNTDYNNPNSLGFKFRARRIQPLLRIIETVSSDRGHVKIIDIGGSENYWDLIPEGFLAKNKVSITIVNLPCSSPPVDHGPFRFTWADACDLSNFQTDEFHIAHSNSVVEHVGDWSRMKSFAGELTRVAEFYFVQTPSIWFPIEPHAVVPFFHWLPEPARVWFLKSMRVGKWKKVSSVSRAVETVQSVQLLSFGMLTDLFPAAMIKVERVCGLPKSYVATVGPLTDIPGPKSSSCRNQHDKSVESSG